MGYRRKARECALQMLYQIDMTGEDEAGVRRGFWASNPAPDPVRGYADRVVCGTVANRERIDRHITAAAEHWRLERMSRVDRNVLRLAIYEFLCEPDTPPKVAINEALEVCKKYSTEEAAEFVNGVLDAVRRELDPTPRAPAT